MQLTIAQELLQYGVQQKMVGKLCIQTGHHLKVVPEFLNNIFNNFIFSKKPLYIYRGFLIIDIITFKFIKILKQTNVKINLNF